MKFFTDVLVLVTGAAVEAAGWVVLVVIVCVVETTGAVDEAIAAII
jgi:hypothetical protein